MLSAQPGHVRHSFCWFCVRCGSSGDISFVESEQHGHRISVLKLHLFLESTHWYYLNKLLLLNRVVALLDLCPNLRNLKAEYAILS